MIIVNCVVCGVEFEKTRKDKTCCSKKCAKKNYISKLLKLKCPRCNIEFETEKDHYVRRLKENKTIYCSHACSAKNSNKNRAKHKILKCEGCLQKFEVLASDQRKKYCSKNCYFEHQHDNLVSRALELRQKKSRFKKGIHFSSKTHKKYKYRSGWELKYMQYLDNNPDILTYDYECLKIPYTYRKKIKTYCPDFIVGNMMIEIKPVYKLTVKKNIAKFAAGREYCKQNGMEYKILTEIELKELGIL
jgi:hypothetical protein